MRRLLPTIVCCLLCTTLWAQRNLRIHYKDGTQVDIPINTIDSLTIADTEGDGTVPTQATLTGSWLWTGSQQGYYELLTFAGDFTYTGYDNYFTYGFDTQTFGWYSYFGTMLTLQSNGYGYQWRYQWFVTALTDNALSVVTRNGPFTYYRLQPEVLRLKAQGEPLPCSTGDAFLFADGVTCVLTDSGALQGLIPGTTYTQKRIGQTGKVLSYKVIVE